MDSYFINKKRKRREDTISYGKVERMRQRLELNKNDMAELLGITPQMLRIYENKGSILAFRVFSAQRAIELEARKKADKIIDDVRNILMDNEDY